ncbi:hypothetical protein D3M96_15070 [Alcaligenes aquatilis]|uniref:Uncharacterized protein n=1 Tax=Alcaligenes aquatilis TaxID=323284 RepID=A0A3G2HXF4_9BURK|nr:hypothetical protein D3M96_15070 [Alcaligenes aquatilis]
MIIYVLSGKFKVGDGFGLWFFLLFVAPLGAPVQGARAGNLPTLCVGALVRDSSGAQSELAR